jgi:hypothetical protein
MKGNKLTQGSRPAFGATISDPFKQNSKNWVQGKSTTHPRKILQLYFEDVQNGFLYINV